MSETKVSNECDCASTPNQVCDICQGLSKPWRKEVFPDGPWSYVWHGSGEDRGYTLKHGRENIAYLGDQISSEDMQDIAWAHNVEHRKLRALGERWQGRSSRWQTMAHAVTENTENVHDFMAGARCQGRGMEANECARELEDILEERESELNSKDEKLRQYLRELIEEIELFRDQMWADSGESDTWSDGFRSGKGSAAHRILNRLRGILAAK